LPDNKFFGPLAPLEKAVDVVNEFNNKVVYELIAENELSPHVIEHIMALNEYESWGKKIILSGEIPEGVDAVLATLPTKVKMIAFLSALREMTGSLAQQDFQANVLRENAPDKLAESITNTQLLHQHGLANEYIEAVGSGRIKPDADVMEFIINHESQE
jgi:hypothetical protein